MENDQDSLPKPLALVMVGVLGQVIQKTYIQALMCHQWPTESILLQSAKKDRNVRIEDVRIKALPRNAGR